MRMQHKSIVLACFIVLLFGIVILNAQWVEDGVPVCIEVENQQDPQIIADGKGGAIIAWADDRNYNYDIFAQRLNDGGYAQWAFNGTAVCTLINGQSDPRMIPDDDGGAIITWEDDRSGVISIYAQRIDSSGIAQWTGNGIVVCTLATDVYEPRITTDGFGGAIIAWEDYRNGSYDIYAQRIDADSNSIWTTNGVAVCTAIEDQQDHEIISDGAGGVILAWLDGRVNEDEIYAQRIDGSGAVQWTADGIAVCTVVDYKYDLRMVPDGSGGAVIAWRDGRDGDPDIYIQRISMDGVTQWTSDGVAVTNTDLFEFYPQLILTSNNDIIITWDQQGPEIDDMTFLVQRVSLDGQLLWPGGGIDVKPTSGPKGYTHIVTDGVGGAIAVYFEAIDLLRTGISAQRINANGDVMWQAQGVPVYRENFEPDYPAVAPDGEGGVLITWCDARNSLEYDIYALKLNRAGFIGNFYPAPWFTTIEDVPKDQGGKLGLRWHRSEIDSFPGAGITHYSLWRLLPDMGASPLAAQEIRSLKELGITEDFEGAATRYLPLTQGYAWEWLVNVPARQAELYARTVESLYDSIGTDPGWQYFIVTAHTADPIIFFDSPVDSGYSVDNLSPAQPTGFAGIQSLAPQGLRLSWLPNTESDLSHYSIHRGDNEFFVPDGSNQIGTTLDTVLIDTDWIATDYYFYKMLAVDVHGNAGPDALLRPEDIKVGTLLQSYAAVLVGERIEVSWTLSEAGEGMAFFVLKARGAAGPLTELSEPSIMKKELSYTFTDDDTEPGETYRYRVEVEDAEGRRALFETKPVTTPALPLTLYQNHPNPFNPTTVIRYYLPERSHVVLDVYGISGGRIVRLVDRMLERGMHHIDWNGIDAQGISVASGVYFYRLSIGKETKSKKMILLR
ncbi:MAG: T9SS type A sorting domain-containing protein [bacterium]|nr:MAG: T9SS type A sorting domain-containing protein [bacterium]